MPLILVPTPLGNLRDITLRALDTLRAAALIVAEDTRTAQRLLHALEIPAPAITAFHAHSASGRIDEIIARAGGELVAVLTDAGMPGISDPGGELVRAARTAGIAVEVLPGPCAFIGAAVLSGLPIAGLQFLGFVPRRHGARQGALLAALAAGNTVAWYESPHRIIATLDHLTELEPTALVFILREYTKRFEQQSFGTPAAVRQSLSEPVRGEITLVFRRAAAPADQPREQADIDAHILRLLHDGQSAAAIAKTLAKEGWGERGEIYRDVERVREASRALRTSHDDGQL